MYYSWGFLVRSLQICAVELQWKCIQKTVILKNYSSLLLTFVRCIFFKLNIVILTLFSLNWLLILQVTILRGQSNLKMRKIIQTWTKTRPIFDGFAQFLYQVLPFENTLTSKDVQRGCHDVFRGHGILKKQKFVQKLRETAKNLTRFCWWHWPRTTRFRWT